MSKFYRILWGSAAAVCAVAASSSAFADVYSYTESGGSGLTIANVGVAPGQAPFGATLSLNTATGTGSLVGNDVNINFTGNFAGFTGGASPMGMYNIAIQPGSAITYNGNSYGLDTTGHQDMLKFMGSSINLWAEWQSASCPACAILGDTVGNISSSSTSGGTAVPEPGMVGLMGLGVMALAFRRRIAAVAAA